ncbi:MAG TPA: NAD(P)-binding domain-containing protein, partial [Chitinophaga sp.]
MSKANPIAIIGSGSWATALAKILTDNGHCVYWWIRNEDTIRHMQLRHHNKHYLTSVYFNTAQLQLSNNLQTVVEACDVVILAVPSAFLTAVLDALPQHALRHKNVISAIKGMIPEENRLINEYLLSRFGLPLEQYFTITGPCHAEEVAAEKLSYLTFSGLQPAAASAMAALFTNANLQTVVNTDVIGVQYAALLKNIYALGAGIGHGLDYGDNFLSVLITNSFREMQGFLEKYGQYAGTEHHLAPEHDYNASAYLGDL